MRDDVQKLLQAPPLNHLDLADDGQEQAAPAAWPSLHKDAMPGLAGYIVKAACQNSEADPAAVLMSLLVRFAATVGDGPYVALGDTRHPPRLYCVKVGASSRARKGTSEGSVARIFEAAESALDDVPPLNVVHGPLSSGEGVVFAVRDPSEATDKETGLPLDPGVEDKRLMVLEGEYASALKASQREGNTLSAILRSAWDHGNIAPLTKTSRIKATGAHVCLMGHITFDELLRLLSVTDVFNGMANRILWTCVRRQKLVPLPRGIDPTELTRLGESLAARIEVARGIRAVRLSEDAAARWRALYDKVSDDAPGAFGAVTSRAEAQVIRLSLVYALLEGCSLVQPEHLRAALAVWEYCRESARFIFGDSETDPVANRILQAIATEPKTQTELIDIFARKIDRHQLNDALQTLQTTGKVRAEKASTTGRPRTIWHLRDGVVVTGARKGS